MKFFDGLSIFRPIFMLHLSLGIVKSLSNGDVVFSGYPDYPKFNHLAIHEDNGTVFIGAVNHLYKLSSDLELLEDVETNPNSYWKNYNKILLINYQKTQLIACGCTTEFNCEAYNLNSNSSKLVSAAKKLIGRMEANNEKTSTVAFISTYDKDQLQKLYVAVSYCGNPENLPAITVRNLSMENIFEMYKEGVNFDSKEFNRGYRDAYGVNYVYGFDYGKYSYFLTTQRNDAAQRSPYVSKLIRLCHNELSLWQGYAEILIECKFNSDTSYNLIQAANVGKPNSQLATSLNINMNDSVLYATFSKSRGRRVPSNEPSDCSALCIYSLKAIDEKFDENIRDCFNGNGFRGFPSINLGSQCIKENNNTDSKFCSSDRNMPFSGSQPITALPVITFNTTRLTALVTKLNKNYTDVFVGTDRGHLKKILVKEIESVCEQADLTIDEGSPVNSDLLFSPNYEYLYVMTAHNLTKIKVPASSVNCSKYEDMRTCLKSVPKYCGWCWWTDKCSTKCDCSFEKYYSWFSNDSRDVGILEDNSNEFQIGAVKSLLWRATTLPAANEKLICEFRIGDKRWYTFGEFYPEPFNNMMTFAVPPRHEFLQIPANKNYLNATLSISKPAVSISVINITFFDCNWYNSCETCISSMFKCEWCPLENMCRHLAAENCAKKTPIELKSIINIPSRIHTAINIETNFPLKVCSRNFNLKCLINVKRNMYIKGALFKNDTLISCGDVTFTYTSNEPLIRAPVSIMLETPTSSDIIFTTVAIIHKCQHMAYDYYTCRRLNPTYKCEWCKSTDTCEFHTNCSTEQTNSRRSNKHPDKVDVNRLLTKSSQNSKSGDPNITSFSPNQGPLYGGTVLTIKGDNLKPGNFSTLVFVGNTPCLVILHNSSTIQCITNSVSTETEAKISMIFDNTPHTLTSDSFTYVKDPQRDSKGFNYQPKGIAAGGVEILIRNVTTVPTEQLFFHARDEKRIYNSTCKIKSGSDLVWSCLSPHFPDVFSDSIDVNDPRKLKISFTSNMTNSTTLSDLGNQSLRFWLYPNPVFKYFFNSSVKFGGDIFVIIEGENIDKACQKTDINVNVGNYTCEVISISSKQAICSLPKYLSTSVMNESEQEYDLLAEHTTISVSIGANFSVVVPKQDFLSTGNQNTNYVYSGVLSVMGVIIFIFAALYFIVWKKKNGHSRAVKKLQQQVNIMGREAIAMKQYMKRVIIKNQIDVDENSSKILKLPNVEIENTSILKVSNGTSAESEYILPLDGKWEFPKSNLTLGRCLGEGEFGRVVQGEAKNILKENITTTVAVKMLKNDHSDEDMIDLVSELEIMKLIGTHINVLRLLGCCTKDGVLFVITEYAGHGNLRDFLRKHIPLDNEITTISLSQKKLVTFAVQVAKGMEYLTSTKCVHRDLAARNILVSDNYILKIADFGLARDITNKEYYRKKTDGRLPVKWMAPESLCHRMYSSQSDVWSYGILLWEIFTLGGAPYPSLLDVGKLYQALRSGYRMEKPPNCSVKIYSLMHKCWSFRPRDRPSFSTVVKNLEDTLLSDKTLVRHNAYWPEKNESDDTEDETDHLLE